MNNIGQVRIYFEKIKKAHDIFVKVGDQKQRAIVEAYQPIFDKLEELGVDRTFSESLLIWGKEFVDSLRKKKLKIDQQQFLDIPSAPGATIFVDGDKRLGVSVIHSVSDELKDSAASVFQDDVTQQIKDAEEVFGVKSSVPSAQSQREFDLAKKHGVWWWKSLSSKDGKVKIQAVAEYKKGVDSQS